MGPAFKLTTRYFGYVCALVIVSAAAAQMKPEAPKDGEAYIGAVIPGLIGKSASRTLIAQNPATDAQDPRARQVDLIDVAHRLFKIKTKPEDNKPKQLELLILPVIDQNPTTGFVFGVGATGTYRTKGEGTQLSEFKAAAAYSSKSQLITGAKYNHFTPGNQWNLNGEIAYVDASLPAYGLGSDTPKSAEDLIDFKLLALHQAVHRQIHPGLFAGMGYNLDLYNSIHDRLAATGQQTPFMAYGVGTSGTSTSSGVSFDLLLEKRDNPINATSGQYASASYKVYPKFLGSDQNWQSIYLDGRTYLKLSESGTNVLALWAFGWFTVSGNPPYLELPGLATPFGHAGRGYTQGRYRGKNAVYGEAEYRFGISKNGLFGGVVFASMGSVSEPGSNNFSNLIPAGGVGLRVKFNKFNGSNLRVDYAHGKQGSDGIYLGIDEAF